MLNECYICRKHQSGSFSPDSHSFSKHQSVACPMKLLAEPNGKIRIFWRKKFLSYYST